MSDLSAIRKRVVTLTSSSENEPEVITQESGRRAPEIVLSAGRPTVDDEADMPTLSIQSAPVKKLRMSDDAPLPAATEETEQGDVAIPSGFRAMRGAQDMMSRFSDHGSELPAHKSAFHTGKTQKWIKGGALFFSATWVGLCASYITTSMGWNNLWAMPPHVLGGVLSGMMAPLALVWIVMALFQRKSDMQMYADALRGELHSMIFPSDDGVRVMRQEMEDMVRQAAELSSASNTVLKSVHRIRTGLRSEMQGLVGISKKTEGNIDELSQGLQERSTKLMQILMEMEERTVGIDGKALAETRVWEEAAHAMRSRAQEIESLLGQGAENLVNAAQAASDKAESITGAFNGLDEAAAKTAQEAAKLESVLQERIEALESLTKRAGTTIAKANQSAQAGKGRLGLRISEDKSMKRQR